MASAEPSREFEHSQGGKSPDVAPSPASGGVLLSRYKPEQGKTVRMWTFVGLAALSAWGAVFASEQLAGYEGPAFWQLLVSKGIPLLVAVAMGLGAFWVAYKHRAFSDFLIATEGEMKKVSWSTRREVLGATKVVIVVTVIFATLLFLVDLGFMNLFRLIGVLKSGG